jgi:hypothetical protein
MSLSTMVKQFRVIVVAEFMSYAEQSSCIDIESLRLIADSFMETRDNIAESQETIDTSPVVKKKRGRKKKVEEDSCDFCRMPQINEDKCMARCYSKGLGNQCSRKTLSDNDYCKMHAKTDLPILGRIDEPRHLNKQGSNDSCGWRYFKDNGEGVEEVEEVLQQEEEVLQQEEEVQQDVQALFGLDQALEEEVPAPAEESPAPAEEVPELVEVVPAPAEEVQELVEVVPAPAEEAPAPAEEVPELAEEVPAPAEEVPAPAEEVPAPAEEVQELVDEDNECPKTGTYQGVAYRFNPIGDGQYTIQYIDMKSVTVRDVGTYDGEDMLFNDEWQEVHDMRITNEENGEIIWD